MSSIDTLIRANTAFLSLEEMLNAGGRYRPSCDMREPVMVAIADAYDGAQEARGDERRAYRYGVPPFKVGQRARVWINQGRREVRVVAVKEGRALGQYLMPNGRAYAVELLAPITHPELHRNLRNISQNRPPAFWRAAVRDHFDPLPV